MLAVIDYGIGNTCSVLNALEYIGGKAILTRDPIELEHADALILPGVGAFGEGMRKICSYNLLEMIKSSIQKGKPILGICLGFQLLMRSSTEMGFNNGFEIFPLDVVRISNIARLPHIGWASVSSSSSELRLLKGLDRKDFYFVHSYGVIQANCLFPHAVTDYANNKIISLIEQKNVFGVQFHPEKSGDAGLALLRNFIELI